MMKTIRGLKPFSLGEGRLRLALWLLFETRVFLRRLVVFDLIVRARRLAVFFAGTCLTPNLLVYSMLAGHFM
jgi:hypothetical protein